MQDQPIRYGVIGLGRAGWGIHVRDLCSRDDAEIVAVVDSLEARREEAIRELGCEGFEHLEDMLERDSVQVAVIATPSVHHGPDAIQALSAGKHVVVEKPMALNVEEADRMIDTADRVERRLFVHQNYRFNPEIQHMLKVARSGKIGQLYHIRNYINSFYRRNDWQTLSQHGGGVLNNSGPHLIDVILQLLGAPVIEVMGDLQQIASVGDVEDHVKAFLRAANGCTADVEVTTAQNIALTLPKWILCGTRGTLTYDGEQSVMRWFDEADTLEVIDGAARDRKYGNDDQLTWQEETVKADEADVSTFYDNVTSVLRYDEPMVVTPESGREVIRVLEMIRARSSRR